MLEAFAHHLFYSLLALQLIVSGIGNGFVYLPESFTDAVQAISYREYAGKKLPGFLLGHLLSTFIAGDRVGGGIKTGLASRIGLSG